MRKPIAPVRTAPDAGEEVRRSYSSRLTLVASSRLLAPIALLAGS
jgi:hypothetical protein